MSKLPPDFYYNSDAVALAKALIGMELVHESPRGTLAGIITETEAYCAPEDKASHAFGGRRTPRTEIMYQTGGHAYIYLCYGIHHLFNVVCSIEDDPKAILIRSLWPVEGLSEMRLNRKGKSSSGRKGISDRMSEKLIARGPGNLCKAMAITRAHNGSNLNQGPIYIRRNLRAIPPELIEAGPRIGIDYAEDYVNVPWRFVYRPFFD